MIKFVCIVLMLVILCVFLNDVALAQVPAPASAPPSNTTTVARPMYFEILITTLMCGLAVYAVCRNSNRN